MFLAVLIFLVFLFIALLSMFPVKVVAAINSEMQPDVHIIMSWLNPLLKAYISRHQGKTTFTVRLLNRKVFIRDLNIKQGAVLNLRNRNFRDYYEIVKSMDVNSAKISASYGFEDPSVTGMLYGAIDFISQYINLDTLYNNADFFVDSSYFNISAEVEINGVASLMRFLRKNTGYKTARALDANR